VSERPSDDARDEIGADLHSIQHRLARLHRELKERPPVDGDARPDIASGDPIEMSPLTRAQPPDDD
jgi:hypothetical protein